MMILIFLISFSILQGILSQQSIKATESGIFKFAQFTDLHYGIILNNFLNKK